MFVLHKYNTDRPEILGTKEGIKMNKMSFVKGMGAGMIVGAAVGMVMPKKSKSGTVGKAIRSVGDVVENVAATLGL